MVDLKLISDVALVALTTWREARGQPRQVKLAVAHSIMNRVRSPGWWGSDVPSVIGKAWQYSSLTDPRDPQLTRWPRWDPAWVECLEVARAAVLKEEPHPAPGADSYYDLSISPPNWADPARFVAQLGRIRFFNLGRSRSPAGWDHPLCSRFGRDGAARWKSRYQPGRGSLDRGHHRRHRTDRRQGRRRPRAGSSSCAGAHCLT